METVNVSILFYTHFKLLLIFFEASQVKRTCLELGLQYTLLPPEGGRIFVLSRHNRWLNLTNQNKGNKNTHWGMMGDETSPSLCISFVPAALHFCTNHRQRINKWSQRLLKWTSRPRARAHTRLVLWTPGTEISSSMVTSPNWRCSTHSTCLSLTPSLSLTQLA